MLDKAIKGAQVSILVGIAAAFLATFIGTLLGAIGGYFGGKAGDFLEWLYNVFTSIPYILLIFALAAVFKYGPLGKVFSSSIVPVVRHPRRGRLDRHLPPGARRVHEAPQPRIRSRGRSDRRRATCPACSATSCRTSATWCWCN